MKCRKEEIEKSDEQMVKRTEGVPEVFGLSE